jgi:hypothetical protein
MSSCTNSSNIQSNLITQVIREEGDGKRVAFKITTTDAGISAGVTVGSVLRYDVPTNMYMPSIADQPDTAEVIGIVETVQDGTYTIVASGLIKYPGITGIINRYSAGCSAQDGTTAGGSGGADIFFLSDGCAGKLQALEPITTGHIVKPVMQRVAVGEYNGIVLNYIGYEVANAGTSDQTTVVPAGAVYYAPRTDNYEGFIDASASTEYDVSQYPELYDIFKTDYGNYEETVKLDSAGINLSTIINSTITQKNSLNVVISTGTIVKTDQTNSTITIKKDSTQEKTNLSSKLVVGTLRFVPLASDVTAFTVPSVPEQKINYTATSGSKEETLVPYMRIQKDVTSVFVPDNIQIDSITCDQIRTQGVTVGDKLQNLELRIQQLEGRLGI